MTDRDVESISSRAKFVETLRRVADAIERREPIRIQVASQRFWVPADAELSVEHEREGADEELELQLRWRNDADEETEDAPPAKARPKVEMQLHWRNEPRPGGLAAKKRAKSVGKQKAAKGRKSSRRR